MSGRSNHGCDGHARPHRLAGVLGRTREGAENALQPREFPGRVAEVLDGHGLNLVSFELDIHP